MKKIIDTFIYNAEKLAEIDIKTDHQIRAVTCLSWAMDDIRKISQPFGILIMLAKQSDLNNKTPIMTYSNLSSTDQERIYEDYYLERLKARAKNAHTDKPRKTTTPEQAYVEARYNQIVKRLEDKKFKRLYPYQKNLLKFLLQQPAIQGEPEERHWDGLPRNLMSAREMGILIGADMRKHLERRGQPIPDWLDAELYDDHHISAGDMCVWIYKAIRQSMTEDL